MSFFTFGVAGYTLQAGLLIIMMLFIKKVKFAYFLSFVTAALYGFILDGAVMLVGFLPNNLPLQIILCIVGALLCCAALCDYIVNFNDYDEAIYKLKKILDN